MRRPNVRITPANAWSRAERFWDRDLWTDRTEAGIVRRAVMRGLRVAFAAGHAFQDRQLNLHATGLVYATLLSVVPLLAVTVSVLKAFGVHYRLEPMLARMLEPLGSQAAEVSLQVVEFVSRVNVGVLGAFGLAGLFYTTLSLIGRIEDALNEIWNVRRSRSLRRKFSDYLSVLLVGPVLVVTALTFIASVQDYRSVQWILRATHLEKLAIFVMGYVMPFVLLAGAFTFLYRFLPYTPVRSGAAIVGGVTAAVMWDLVGIGFTALVASSTGYAAIYSTFAVVIVCLLWLQVAWLVVLVGAQVAYVHQRPLSYAKVRLRQSVTFRERIGLAALIEVTRRYLAGERPFRLEELAGITGAPFSVLQDVVEAFLARGILVRVVEPEGVMLSRPPEAVTLIEALEAVHEPVRSDARSETTGTNAVSEVLGRRDQAVRSSLGDVTLRSLAATADRADSTVAELARYRHA